MEAADGGVTFIVCITEGIPAQDEALFYNQLRRDYPETRLLGPNCPGIISPGKCNIGITSGDIALAGGPVGIVCRSGTLTYQALHELSQQGVGQTTCVGIGGDPVPGTSFIDCLAAFEDDPETRAIMMIGEIGGSAEEQAAAVHRRAHDQAGRLLHRRRHRPARAQDGPCRRHHLRFPGHGPGQDGGPRAGRCPGGPEPHRSGGEDGRGGERPVLTPGPRTADVRRAGSVTGVRLGVLVSGTGTILEALLAEGLPVVVVLADRPCRGLEIAADAGLATELVDRRSFGGFGPAFARDDYTGAVVTALRRHEVDLVVMAGFGTVLTEPAHDAYEGRILNTHPALLPAFPGWHAVEDALAAGATVTGCTVHLATVDMDAGPILAQEEVAVRSDDTAATLHERIKEVERRLYPATIRKVIAAGVGPGESRP